MFQAGAEDPNLFWYGSWWQGICAGNTQTNNASCFNPLPTGGTAAQYRTLGARLFVDPDFKSSKYLANLTHRLDITFDSTPGLASAFSAYLTGNASLQRSYVAATRVAGVAVASCSTPILL